MTELSKTEKWFLEPSQQARRRETIGVIVLLLFVAAYVLIEVVQAYMEGRFPCPK
jgi:hypothetical protein